MKLHELKPAEGSRKNVTALVVVSVLVMVKLLDAVIKVKTLVQEAVFVLVLKVVKTHCSAAYQNVVLLM